MTETRWPLRVRFAHWVLGLISPWLSETPVDEEELEMEWERQQAEERAAYEAGIERGYERAMEDCDRRGDRW